MLTKKQKLACRRMHELERQAGIPMLVSSEERDRLTKVLESTSPEYAVAVSEWKEACRQSWERRDRQNNQLHAHADVLFSIWADFGDQLTPDQAHSLRTAWNLMFTHKPSPILKADKEAKKNGWGRWDGPYGRKRSA